MNIRIVSKRLNSYIDTISKADLSYGSVLRSYLLVRGLSRAGGKDVLTNDTIEDFVFSSTGIKTLCYHTGIDKYEFLKGSGYTTFSEYDKEYRLYSKIMSYSNATKKFQAGRTYRSDVFNHIMKRVRYFGIDKINTTDYTLYSIDPVIKEDDYLNVVVINKKKDPSGGTILGAIQGEIEKTKKASFDDLSRNIVVRKYHSNKNMYYFDYVRKIYSKNKCICSINYKITKEEYVLKFETFVRIIQYIAYVHYLYAIDAIIEEDKIYLEEYYSKILDEYNKLFGKKYNEVYENLFDAYMPTLFYHKLSDNDRILFSKIVIDKMISYKNETIMDMTGLTKDELNDIINSNKINYIINREKMRNLIHSLDLSSDPRFNKIIKNIK